MTTRSRPELRVRDTQTDNERIETPRPEAVSPRTRLIEKIDALRREWKLRNEKLEQLRQAQIMENRPEERFRLHYLVADETAMQNSVEQELNKLESQLDNP